MKTLKIFMMIILMPPRLIGFLLGLFFYTAYIGYDQSKQFLQIIGDVK